MEVLVLQKDQFEGPSPQTGLNVRQAVLVSGDMTEPSRKRRTQRERREATRDRILDAARKTLVERGWAGASTWAVCETGGFAKGTLLYHFRKRTHLFQAVIADMTQQSLGVLQVEMDLAPGHAKVETFLTWLWSTLEGDFFVIGLEMLTAARTEPDLRQTVRIGADALDALLDNIIEQIVDTVPDKKREATQNALRVSVHMVRGIGLDLSVGGDRAEHYRRYRLWCDTVIGTVDR